jgi:L-ribulose-5-phosphate 3-epimerase
MKRSGSRRQFLGYGSSAAALGLLSGCASIRGRGELFKISLAEWSFHKTLFEAKTMTNLDFPILARRTYGIGAVEYVNQFFKDKAKDYAYLRELKTRCDGEGVRSVLIMCDGEGELGDVDPAKRSEAVSNHHKWVDAARFLGCHSIRVNAATGGQGSFEEQQRRAADGLFHLAEYGARMGINIIVENHGGLSSNGEWLVGVMRLVGSFRCGTLPDFGNFTDYDRYRGVEEMMPYAKGVSAKSNDFDDAGNETQTDYRRMLKIVLAAHYHGYIGIEYEGSRLSEHEGVLKTKQLLEKVRAELA